MFRKLLLLILALAAIAIAFISYQKYYARKDVTRMMNEARLTASVKTALALNRHLKNTEIEVSASGEMVILSGAVGTDIQKQLAEEVVLSIKGVNKVRNTLIVSRALTLKPTVQERTLGEKLDDLTIEASIKTAFLLNENVSARGIGVSSNRGLVTLTGTVVSPAEAELARKIAEDIDGVASVRIKVGVEGAGEKAGDASLIERVDDARVVAQVRAALMVNRNIDSTEIEVSSRGGVVTLTGIVHSGAEKELAQKITEDCWGVQGVINELRIK
ncbi:MAG: BON domain-containing protein [Candidatus Hydrogenedentota bacterium]|nr:MAG: BON domain-containing protein [Candidatus Hydrogenedentota bacterium]